VASARLWLSSASIELYTLQVVRNFARVINSAGILLGHFYPDLASARKQR
jgi:uncharacterized membrane protein